MRAPVKLMGFALILATALGGGLAAGMALGPFEDGGSGGGAEMSETEHAPDSGHAPARVEQGDDHAD